MGFNIGDLFSKIRGDVVLAQPEFMYGFDEGLRPGMEIPLLNLIGASDIFRKQALSQADDSNPQGALLIAIYRPERQVGQGKRTILVITRLAPRGKGFYALNRDRAFRMAASSFGNCFRPVAMRYLAISRRWRAGDVVSVA